MPEKNYDFWISNSVKCIVRFVTEKGKTTGFVVRLIAFINNQKFEIRRYDTAHGTPHIDVLNLKGETIEKIWLYQFDEGEALDFAIEDIKQNYLTYINRFIK